VVRKDHPGIDMKGARFPGRSVFSISAASRQSFRIAGAWRAAPEKTDLM